MRGLVLLVAALPACVEPNLIVCDDLICPAGTACLTDRESPVCASPEAIAVCEAVADGTPCETTGVDGACDRGACIGSTCGDGVRTGREQCDGSVGAATCGDFRTYYGELTCNASCLLDASACYGTCGDGLIQDDQGEVCDGATPVLGCAQLGYDYGHIACTTRCGDTSRDACATYRMRFVYSSGQAEILRDVYRDDDQLIVSELTRLVIVQAGQRVEHPGSFGTIAVFGDEIVVAHDATIEQIVGSTLVDLADPGFVDPIADLAYAPNGDLYAISTTGQVRRRSGTQWSVHSTVDSTVEATQVAHIAIGPTGELYAAFGPGNVYYFDGGQWRVVSTHSIVGDLDLGRTGSVAAMTSEGIVELRAGVPKLSFANEYVIDGVSVGEAYFVASLAPAHAVAGRRTIYAENAIGTTPQRARRMPDGSVLGWEGDVYELGSIFGYARIANFQVVGFARGGKSGLLYFSSTVLAEFGTLNDFSFPSQPLQVMGAGARVYIAMGSHVAYGTLEGGMTVEPAPSPTSMWGDATGNMAKVQGGVVYVRPIASSWRALPSSGCDVFRVFGAALDELYVIQNCASQTTLGRWDGQTWSTVYAPLYGSDPAQLGDGTFAIAGGDVVVGRGTTWSALPFGATSVSGTSANDLFLSGVPLPPSYDRGIAHWDGVTLAQLRHPRSEDQTHEIYGDATSVMISGIDEAFVFGRFALR